MASFEDSDWSKSGDLNDGPPVRPLNRYETSIDDRRHLILGQLYAVDDSLQRHQLKGPGQPLNGILRFLYPEAPAG